MTMSQSTPSDVGNADNTMLHIAYLLYGLALFTGIPVRVGLLVAYLQRGRAANPFKNSHADWQIWTFWWGLALITVGLSAAAILYSIVGGGLLIFYLVWFLVVAWFIYRIAKGWRLLGQAQAIERPRALF